MVRMLAPSAALALAFWACEAKRYDMHDPVMVSVNKVGPFNNPTETYPYYSLPYCRNTGRQRAIKHDLGEFLLGDRKMESHYEITFRDDFTWRTLCSKEMSGEEMRRFRDAIEDDYYFEMFVDDLPMWGFVGVEEGSDILVGHLEGSRTFLFPHIQFTFGYNGDRIVSAQLSTNPQKTVDISDAEASEVIFSYSVQWVHEPDLPYEQRMSRYHDSAFLPDSFEIHWLSIINSIVLVLLLTAILSVILMRVLKNDYSRYMEPDYDSEELAEEEVGWKLIHGDVFRTPSYPSMLSALSGAGAQLCVTTVVLLGSALIGVYRPTKRGAMLTSFIFIYSVSAFVGGFVAARLYKQLDGRSWVWNIVATAFVFPAPLAAVFVLNNSVAAAHRSTAALPITTILVIFALFLFVTLPLTVIGGVVGRNTTGRYEAPCRTNKQPREIPSDGPWYQSAAVQFLMAGLLPFSAIYVELHYIFAAMWGHKMYTLFGILCLAFLMLYIVTSFITVALVYFQLAREDYRWYWRSYISAGMTGPFIYLYAFVYYGRSQMTGALQTTAFFTYMGAISWAFFLMLGYVGFSSSNAFVRHVYSVIKIA